MFGKRKNKHDKSKEDFWAKIKQKNKCQHLFLDNKQMEFVLYLNLFLGVSFSIHICLTNNQCQVF